MSDLPAPERLLKHIDEIRATVDLAVELTEAALGRDEANRIYEQSSMRRCQAYKNLSLEQRVGYFQRLYDALQRRAKTSEEKR